MLRLLSLLTWSTAALLARLLRVGLMLLLLLSTLLILIVPVLRL
jgi:hypothetical protein